MSLELFQQEANDRLSEMQPVQNADPGMFDGFFRGTGMATMKGFAKAGRAIDLMGSIPAIVQDAFSGGTEAQDKYFKGHDAIFGSAVDYWTPKSTEIGSAAEVMGSLLSTIPQVLANPALAIATTQLGTGEDLVNAGVTSGKANLVGAVQGATLATGIWMPILGNNLWQRAMIGGAGFNLAQGIASRAASAAIIGDENPEARDMFKAFDGEAMTLDTLMGMAFGGLVHYSPTQRAQGTKAWADIKSFVENWDPSAKAALATLREAQHLNTDSTPGKPVDAPTIDAHVKRMREAIDQLARDKPVNVEDIMATRTNEEGVQENVPPEYTPDPERARQMDATVAELRDTAEVVRAEDGIAPPPTEPPRVVQSVRQTIEEQLTRAGRPAEEATAGAALWHAFYTTMARRLGTTADDLWSRFPLARITNELPGADALKQNANGEPMLSVDGRLRPITDSTGRRIAADIEELKNFWNWFKDSKLVGQDGKPAPLYHGTSVTFSEFNTPAFFTKDRKGANSYVANNATAGPPEGQVVPVYLRIEKPATEAQVFAAARKVGIDPENDTPSGMAYELLTPGHMTDENVAAVVAQLKKEGFDGAHIENDFSLDGPPMIESWVPFDKTQIKSAIGNRGTFDPKNPNILFQATKGDTWYRSALGEGIDKLNMKQGDAKSWLQALKGLGSKGVKAEEIKWSGLEEWLQLQEGKITKEQVADYLANNGVKVEEVMLGQDREAMYQEAKAKAKAAGIPEDVFSELWGARSNWRAEIEGEQFPYADSESYTAEEGRVLEGLIEPIAEARNETTKFGTYQLPGGENYRELLLTLPATDRLPEMQAQLDALNERMADINLPQAEFNKLADQKDALRERMQQQNSEVFRSSHFDQPNILAHVRFNERTDAEGKKVLFIEEFQSDWAQKGKREGFAEPAQIEHVESYPWSGIAQMDLGVKPGDPAWVVKNSQGRVLGTFMSEDFAKAAAKEHEQLHNGPPAAPFVGKTDAWVGLALKRMIAYAAENGFERVAWTRGEQQVERYTGALRKAVDVIEWTKTDKGVQLTGYKEHKAPPTGNDATDALLTMRNLATAAIERNDMFGFDTVSEAREAAIAHPDWQQRFDVRPTDAVDIQAWLDGRTAALENRPLKIPNSRQKVVDTTEKEDALSDAIGKAMAEKIISDPNQSGTIEGDGIRIDSTGMAGFYDRIVPKVANEVLKKLGGGKVGEVGFAKPEGVPQREMDGGMWAGRQQGFDITPKMKEAVDGGLPLFQKTQGTERGYMSIGDEGRIIGLLEGADASTFVHESGHFFLDTLAAIGKEADTPPEVRADLDTALSWMGVKDPAKWGDMTLAQKRPFHEKFARGFEQYLRDGEAPSPELKGIFQRFRDWLVEVYKSAASLKVKLNDDIRGVLNRMLADQTRNPSTEAPPAPSERTGSPPPPSVGGEAQAGAEAQPDPVPGILERMALDETGWAQEGGKLLNVGELGTGKPSFTTWIPKAEWWTDRPDKKLNAAKVQEAVKKHLAGEKLKPAEQRTVDYMLEIAQDRARGIDRVGGEQEYQDTANDAWDEGLEPTTANVEDLDLVARAAAIDEAYVERAALKYENDDAAFRGELEMLIHENEHAQATAAAGRSKAGEQTTQGKPASPGEGPAKAGDIVRNEADLIAEQYPDMPIHMGTDEAGNAITMTAKEFLEQARAEAQMNRDDIPLLEVAAQCMLGVG